MYQFDYPERIRRVQKKLKVEKAACALIMKPANLRYLTGFWGYATRPEYFEPRRLIVLVVPQNGEPVLVVPKIEFDFAKAATRGLQLEIRRHVEWSEKGETEDAWGVARDFVMKAGITSGTLTVEKQHLTVRAFAALESSFPQFTIQEGSGWVDRMRMIKEPVEIELMRHCGELASSMYEVQAEALARGGYREYEVAMLGLQHVVEKCAEALAHTDVNSPIGEGLQLITSGPRLSRAHGSASCRMIGSDDVVQFDYCRVPYLLGYRAAMGRVVSLRALRSEEREIEATVNQAYQLGVSLLRPGAVSGDVDSAIRQVLINAGLGQYIMHRSGRGVGIEMIELPQIKEGITDRIEEGMIISIEPGIYRDGFCSRIENMLLVTKDAPQVLTPAPTAIKVLKGHKNPGHA